MFSNQLRAGVWDIGEGGYGTDCGNRIFGSEVIEDGSVRRTSREVTGSNRYA